MDEELTLEASIELLLNQVPAPVRSFVLNDLASTTSTLMAKHQLHVDHGGVLERELLLMLLGQSTPDEFIKALTDAGIEEPVVRNITADVNRDVFMRLRDEERKEVASPPIQSAPARVPVPIYSPLPVSAVPPAPPSRVEPPANLPGQLPEPPAPRPVPPPPHIEVQTPAPKKLEMPSAPQSEEHTRILHTMARDMEALKSGADPLRVAHPAPPAWAEVPTKPAPVVPPPAPVVAPQPKIAEPVTPPPSPSPTMPEAARSQEVLRTHLKQYGVDPYREPVE